MKLEKKVKLLGLLAIVSGTIFAIVALTTLFNGHENWLDDWVSVLLLYSALLTICCFVAIRELRKEVKKVTDTSSKQGSEIG